MKGFYNELKDVWGPKKKGRVHMKSTDGMETFSDSKIIVARWSEPFQKLLNVPGDIDHEALDNIPECITKTCFDEIPTVEEMARTIVCLKDGKAPGGDGIYADVWKQSVQQTESTNHQCLRGGFCTTSMEGCHHCNIYKKGDRTDYGNYRGISLLLVAGKIFARILLN
ncbi:hypothetical protein NP493_2600g00002 [Ridgeia piscesae]|uniref:Uncharacterized protein n=1 Tax=Ridgeia piscesae TaxID=27915 RepID=A0AAD9JFA7_RIDPI|nr:hypothetical protein NP493_2600g00002 [Ridgeia piscesae]